MIVLAIVEKLPERYENIKTLMELLNIEKFTFFVCCDLKLQNVIVGIQAHGSTYPCAYCFGKRPDYPDARSRPRTFGEIRKLAREFASAKPKDQLTLIEIPIFCSKIISRILTMQNASK